MTADYCAVTDVENEVGIGDAQDSAKIARSISAASRQIDGWCGRRFWIDETATVREFYASDSRCLDLFDQPDNGPKVDIATATGLIVKIDTDGSGAFGTTLTIGTDFLLKPRNAAADGFGFDSLEALPSAYFPYGYQRPCVQITAKFGFPSIPDDVQKACLIQAAQLFKAKDAVFGAIALGDSQAMRLGSSLNASARALLARYQRSPVG